MDDERYLAVEEYCDDVISEYLCDEAAVALGFKDAANAADEQHDIISGVDKDLVYQAYILMGIMKAKKLGVLDNRTYDQLAPAGFVFGKNGDIIFLQ